MRASFVNAASPLLIGVIRRTTPAAAIADIAHCVACGANAVDVHLSCLEEEYWTEDAIREIVDGSPVPIMALNYNGRYDWSDCGMDEETRVQLLLTAVAAGVSAVDIQGYTYDVTAKNAYHGDTRYGFAKRCPREVVTDPTVIERQIALIERVHAAGAEVVLSTHPGVVMNCEEIVELALFLEKRGPDMIKLVSQCTNEDELAEAMRTMLVLTREVRTPVHFHVAGAAGRLSRIINPILGGHMIFCSGEQHDGANKEQLDLQSAVAVIENMKKLMGE